MSNIEHTPNQERSVEALPDTQERSQELGAELKRHAERHNENEAHQSAETARQEALKEALFSKEQGKEKRSHQADRHNSSHIITPEERNAQFDQTMDRVRKELPHSSRGFSKLIHGPGVERVSDVVAQTVARPNAILVGGITAFVAVLGLYLYAKYAGFALSGSETIIAFAIGWLGGILFDFFKAMITGKN